MKEPRDFWLIKTKEGNWIVSEVPIQYYVQADDYKREEIHVREVVKENEGI